MGAFAEKETYKADEYSNFKPLSGQQKAVPFNVIFLNTQT